MNCYVFIDLEWAITIYIDSGSLYTEVAMLRSHVSTIAQNGQTALQSKHYLAQELTELVGHRSFYAPAKRGVSDDWAIGGNLQPSPLDATKSYAPNLQSKTA